MKKNGITLRAFLVGAFFAAVFAAVTVYIENQYMVVITSTQIPVLPYILLIFTVVLINPVCRLLRFVRAFAPVEIMVIFIMGMVSAGLSTFGLTSQLLPIAGNLFNAEWNNKQSEWNRYVVPYLNEKYFIAEPGIQAAAVQYKQALNVLIDQKAIQEAAGLVDDRQKIVTALAAQLAGLSRQDSAAVAKTQKALDNARLLASGSLRQWQDLRGRQPGLPDWPEVLRRLPAEIDLLEIRADAAEKNLLALEQKAFERVAVLRRGLPHDARAFPGILPLAGDDRRAYFSRLHRLIGGMQILRQIKQSGQAARALPEKNIVTPELAKSFDAVFANAVRGLIALSRSAELKLLSAQLDARDHAFSARRVELAAQLRTISAEKSGASRQRAFELDSQSKNVIAAMRELDRQYKQFKSEDELCNREMDCDRNIHGLVAKIQALQKRLAAGTLRGAELAAQTNELLPMFSSIDVSLRRYFIGQIPWEYWVKPLSRWALLIGLTYVMLMAFNVLIFRQWAHNERLIYPLAELPKALIGDVDATGLPPIFRNGLFWAGVAVAMSVLGWNLFCATQIIPGLMPLDLQNIWAPYVNNTQFHALGKMKTEIFFTMIGLAFLVPKNISFSLWFFYLVFMVQLLFMVWSGHGVNMASFPWDWWYLTNFRNAQGQGALLVFSSLVLYKCRKYILCAWFPSRVADLEDAEQKELRLASIAFLGCSLGLVLILWLSMGANLFYTILFYLIILVITIGLIRVVAEGGLLSFQAWANPVHYVRNLFGLDHAWTSATFFAPLMVYYSLIFLDIKTFIAPAMANALKLREDYRLKRFSFHVAVAAAIAIAGLVAVVVALMMCYDRGSDAMHYWFYSMLPRENIFEIIRSTIKNAPTANAGNAVWTISGGVVMGTLLFFRQFYFWLPHPIGLIMFVNPIMDSYWFSIFLGWLCNVAVTKYGNKDNFQRAKGFFIGLIIGELILVVMAFVVTMLLGANCGIDLNRN